jgi:hypothetical protein
MRQNDYLYIPYGNNEDVTRPCLMHDGTMISKSLGIDEVQNFIIKKKI